MLKDRVRYYYAEQDMNCSESLLYGANDVYELGIDEKGLRIMAAFGGGMGIGSVCGAITGALATLSVMFCEEKAHDTPELKQICKDYFAAFEKKYGSRICTELKEKYHSEDDRCLKVVEMAAEVLQQVVEEQRVPAGEPV